MAGALKQSFIEAVRLTPDGIAAFLETPLPEPPTIGTPADVDAAIIASGVLSKYLLDLFTPFAGLTPIELLLRIGQHNNVLESAMIAGLEYIEGSDSGEQAIGFTEPVSGQSYTPGEVRFTVAVQNGTPDRVNLTVDDGDPLKMTTDDDGATWVQYQTIVATGAHSAGVSAEFAAGDVQTASVTFTIMAYDPENPPDPPPETPPAPPGGTDFEALTRKRALVLSCYRDLIRAVSEKDYAALDGFITSFRSAVIAFLEICPIDNFVMQAKTTIFSALESLTALVGRTDESIITDGSTIMDQVNAIYTYLKE